MNKETEPQVYGFYVIELLHPLFVFFLSGALFYVSYDIYTESNTMDIMLLILFLLVILIIIQGIRLIYDIVTTRITLYDDHFEYKSGKQNIQMKYAHISIVRLREIDAKIQDVYGATLPLPISHVRNAHQIVNIIMDKAVNAEKPEDISNIGRNSYIFYCKSCRKEYYIKAPTGICPKCGTKHLQLNFNLSFRIVKDDKLNERLMFAFWTMVAIGIVLILLYLSYLFNMK